MQCFRINYAIREKTKDKRGKMYQDELRRKNDELTSKLLVTR